MAISVYGLHRGERYVRLVVKDVSNVFRFGAFVLLAANEGTTFSDSDSFLAHQAIILRTGFKRVNPGSVGSRLHRLPDYSVRKDLILKPTYGGTLVAGVTGTETFLRAVRC